MTAAFTKEFLASHPVTFLPSYEGLVAASPPKTHASN
jgi:hypothetical protein